MGLLIYLIVFWGALWLWHQYLSPRPMKLRRRLRLLSSSIHDRIRWDSDILKQPQLDKLQGWRERYQEMNRGKATTEELEAMSQEAQELLGTTHKSLPGWAQYTKEIVELVIVVFGVVAGLRALFLQPFKIPTGSMQPTLYGIHFVDREELKLPSTPKRVLDYVNYSRRYVDQVARDSGTIHLRQDLRSQVKFMLFPETTMRLRNQLYDFPGAPGNVWQYVNSSPRSETLEVEEGQVLARGYLMLGDHLFVDRVSYNFRDPVRGDIVVFVTDNLIGPFGDPLGARYYIKRLVGLPGESLQIRDGKLYVQAVGSDSFELVDAEHHPAFDYLYSGRGGYRGYTHPHATHGGRYLVTPEATVTLGPDEYFMLGDNSASSQDSRYWGAVPRKNIVGRAFFVWWPFSRRWGLVDAAAPEDYATPALAE